MFGRGRFAPIVHVLKVEVFNVSSDEGVRVDGGVDPCCKLMSLGV